MAGQETGNGRLAVDRERKLIRSAQGGCGQSARELIEAHQDRLHAFVWRMVRNREDAEEICQESFLRAFQALNSFNFDYRFSTWLFTIAYRVSLNTIRRRRENPVDIDFNGLPDAAGVNSDSVAEGVASSEEARRLRKAIWDSVERLSAPQRAAILLFYREEMSCQEIGEVLAMPAATVKSHLHRARLRLRELLGSEYVEDWSVVRFDQTGAA